MLLFFVDFKAAFDSIDRKLLWKTLEERGVSQELKERKKEVYEESICKMRAKEKIGREFWTAKEVRQGCPLSVKNVYFNIGRFR